MSDFPGPPQNGMDKDTKYIPTARLSYTLNEADARKRFEEAKRNAGREPETITTDGLPSYPESIAAVFPKAKHKVAVAMRDPEKNNNIDERLQGSFRQRIKTQRPLDAEDGAGVSGWLGHQL